MTSYVVSVNRNVKIKHVLLTFQVHKIYFQVSGNKHMKEKCRGKNKLELYFGSFLCEEKYTTSYEFYSVFTVRKEPSYRHNVGG